MLKKVLNAPLVTSILMLLLSICVPNFEVSHLPEQFLRTISQYTTSTVINIVFERSNILKSRWQGIK